MSVDGDGDDRAWQHGNTLFRSTVFFSTGKSYGSWTVRRIIDGVF